MCSVAVTRHRCWICIFCICLTGCSGLHVTRHSTPIDHPLHLISRVKDHASHLRTFQAVGRISIVSVEGGFRGTVQVKSRIPDSLWIKVEGPFGIDLMSGVIHKDEITLFYPREGLVYKGSPETIWERDLLPVPVGMDGLVLSILGLLVPEGISDDPPAEDYFDGTRRVLHFNSGETIWIEPDGPVVTQAEFKDDEDRTIWKWEAEKFRKRRGVRLPLIIRMTQTDLQRRVTLFFESIRVNRTLRADWSRLRLPEGVETIVF